MYIQHLTASASGEEDGATNVLQNVSVCLWLSLASLILECLINMYTLNKI